MSYSKDVKRYIADEILIEILKLLPTEKLFDFKCVCKKWENIISSNHFGKIYRTFNNASSKLIGFYRSDAEDAFLPTSLQKHSNTADFYFKTDGFTFVDTSNGLLLFCNVKNCIYRVCNPVTKKWRDLEVPHCTSSRIVVAFDAPSEKCDLETLNNFTLIFLVPSRAGDTCVVFTLSPGDTIWNEYIIGPTRNAYFSHLNCAVVVIEGVCYWMTYLKILVYKLPTQVSNRRFIEYVPLPDISNKSITGSTILSESKDGFLQYSRSDSMKISVWVRSKDIFDDKKYKWVLRYTVDYRQISYAFSMLEDLVNVSCAKLMACHPSNPEKVFILLNEIIICYCFHSRRVELVRRIQDTDKKLVNMDRYDPPWEWSRRIVPYFSPKWAASFLESSIRGSQP